MADRIDAISTRWSLLRLAHAGPPDTAKARQMLVLRYASSVRKYVGAIVRNRDEADELAQEVVLRLMRGDFAGADPTRGRFRDFLKIAVRNMVHNHWAKQGRRKTELLASDPVSSDTQREEEWLGAWQKTVLDHALSTCREEDNRTGSSAYTLLKLRMEFPDATSDEMAEKFSAKLNTTIKADACRQMLRRARFKLAQALVEEIENGLEEDTPARVLEELAALELLEHVKDFLPADYALTGKLQG
ncbi:MAG TPA: sigma-70 family RNA polymerase sigma factor [Gemmatales bacterium]|nr:sigma-70 family RNA polymerase sigma factor [Gemmatales bacterium]